MNRSNGWPALAVFVLLGVGDAVSAQSAKIELSEPGWNFGTREQGEKDKKTITVTNRGTSPLILRKIIVNCGCITAKIKQRTIAPGASRPLVLTLDTMKGEWEIKKHIELQTNDPQNPKVLMPMEGKIFPVWWITTQDVVLGRLENGIEHVRKFQVKVRKGKKVKVTKVWTPDHRVKIVHEPFEDEDGTTGWNVTMAFAKDMEAGAFETIIAVSTDWEPRPLRGFRVTGDFVGSVTVSVDKLSLGRVVKGEKASRKVTVRKAVGEGMKVIEVYCKDKRIKSKIVETEPGKTAEVEIEFMPAENDKGVVRGTLWIVVDQPGQARFPVEYHALVATAS